MRFCFMDKEGTLICADMTEPAGYSYAKKNGFSIVSVTPTEPVPLTSAEIEEMLLDQEYRILLLEYGVEEEEPV